MTEAFTFYATVQCKVKLQLESLPNSQNEEYGRNAALKEEAYCSK
jgi:hypothetical protein